MASSSIAIAPDTKLDFRKMNKQELRDQLASRGLDTNGLRPTLIQRLESSSKASAAAAAAAAATAAVSSSTASSTDLATVPTSAINPNSENGTRDVGSDGLSLGLDTDKRNGQKENLKLSLPQQENVEGSKDQVSPVSTTDSKVEKSKTCAIRPISPPRTASSPTECQKETTTPSSISMSDIDKKRRRAERFGVGLKVSEEEKLALRAERFSGIQGKKNTEPESEKRKQRAARFGLVDDSTQKKPRSEVTQEDSVEEKKRQARAARFGTGTAQVQGKETVADS